MECPDKDALMALRICDLEEDDSAQPGSGEKADAGNIADGSEVKEPEAGKENSSEG
jgi:hypothetical protein